MSYNEYSSYSLDPLNRSRFYGIYQGTVLNNTDFENKKRLTVIVPQVTGSDSLTLVRPSAPSGVLNSIQIPEVGAYVWVMFESGDPNYPVWMSSTGGSSTGVTSVDGLTGVVNLTGKYLTQTNAASTYEPKITAGTTAQYWRGDKTWQTFPTIPTATSALTNDSGFITSSALSPYLTTATAASTYEPKITAGTTAQYFRGDKSLATFPTALSSFSNDTNFITSSALTGYLTSSTASTTYAPIAQTMYLGTTSVAINRTSASQSLTGITSIDGTATGISGSQTANTVLAAPNGSSGTASFRALVAADIPSLDAGKITSGVIGNTIAAAPALFYTNYSDISAGTVASAVAIPMFNKSVALAASTIYEIDLSWHITLTTGTTVNTPRLWWNYSGTVDATNPINWEARYTQVSGSTPFSTAETAGNTNQVYPVTAVRLGTTTSPLSAGPGYLASTSYVSKIVGKAIIRTSTAGNLSFNIQAGVTAGNPGYTAFNTKAGSFMRVTPMGTNSGADFSIGIWA